MKKNIIGLDAIKAKKLADLLNVLLANYQLFYINSRGFHWNIKGEKFFELHLKFEELYTDTQLKIDEIAERILTLGHTPDHTYTDFLKLSKKKEKKNITNGVKAVNSVIDAFSILITNHRQLLLLSAEEDDEGNNALMSDYIRQQEKLVWMYSAYLSK